MTFLKIPRLPTSDFKWLENIPDTPQEIDSFLSKYTEDSDKGIFLEGDFEYPNKPKIKLTLHRLYLKFYFCEGFHLTKIHRVLEFNQGTWLKDFLDKNNGLIKNSKNSFEKEIFQMMNENAIVQSGYEPLIR